MRGRKSFVTALALGLATTASAALAQNVVTYHNDAARSGAFVAPNLTIARAANLKRDTKFHASFSGNVYAQPLYWQPSSGDPMIIVATESNTVYALDAATGAEIWHRNLGNETPQSELCAGNIDPVGVTGAPVIDAAHATLYLDALVKTGRGPRHKIFALGLGGGKIKPRWPLDVAKELDNVDVTFDGTAQGQRSALTFINGELFVAYAGIYGDCGDYHGMAVGIQGGGHPSILGFWKTRAGGGGVWGQSGIASDGTSLFFTTGNTFTNHSSPWGDGEAVIRVGPSLTHASDGNHAAYYAPSNWQDLDNSDTDLGGTAPIPVDVPSNNARIVQFGKDGKAYLLDRNNLGGIGGQLAVMQVSNSDIRTGPATYQSGGHAIVVFTGDGAACPDSQSGNLIALRINAGSMAPFWCNSYNGDGSPIVTSTDGSANQIVWVPGAEGDGKLYGFNAATGAQIVAVGNMGGLHHWQTLIAAGDRLYVAADNKVYAFKY